MSITNKGKAWELRNSLWLLWSASFFFAFIPFFWIGVRAKQRKWILFGCLYLVLCFALPMASVEETLVNAAVGDIGIFASLGFIIVAIVHAFLARREYLILRAAIIDEREAGATLYAQTYGQDVAWNAPASNSSVASNVVQSVIDSPPVLEDSHAETLIVPEKIDLNNCTEQHFASLPGVSIALAKQAVLMRSEIGSFSSVKDFCSRLDLMPHFAVQIERLAYVAPVVVPKNMQAKPGRVIDI